MQMTASGSIRLSQRRWKRAMSQGVRRGARKRGHRVMNAKRRRVSHLVRVARVRVETAVVAIEGDDKDDEEAERQAIEKAQLFSDDVWSCSRSTKAPIGPTCNR